MDLDLLDQWVAWDLGGELYSCTVHHKVLKCDDVAFYRRR